MQPVIEVRNVSMRFRMANDRVSGIKEYVIQRLSGKLKYTEFEALKDVSFTVNKGEVVGLIGHNGAGKSTILKVISGILRPSEGSVTVRGNIVPMLELGSGFDMDLTGNENIFLNGAILGYSEEFLKSKYQEIVDFSELSPEFLNMPLRNYSSGMLSRLAFSVATVVEPEVLIVDEVLAVGDADFQKKSMKRMMELMGGGTTVLFVSHSIDQIKKMCNRVVWLDHGRVVEEGSSEKVCADYSRPSMTGQPRGTEDVQGPAVSVLLPNYNGSEFLQKAVDSVLNQSFTDFELIVVEDGSTDGSAELLASYSDPRIRIIPLEQNEHICVALNTGLAAARGKYIARIDSDDCWLPNKLEKQYRYMEENPDCGACFSLVTVVDEKETILTEEQSPFVSIFREGNRTRYEWLRYLFFSGCHLCHSSAFFRRDIVEQLGPYRTSLVQIQDYEYWLRIANVSELYVIQEPLVRYRHRLKGGNVSEATQANMTRSKYEFYNVLRCFMERISDDILVAAFQGDFLRPEAATHEELLCERAFLLLKTDFFGKIGKLAGVDLLVKLIDAEPTRQILREKYGFSQLNLYKLTETGTV